MAAPVKVFAKTTEVKVTSEELAAIKAEMALTGDSFSAVVRRAVDQFFGITRGPV